MPSPPPLLHGTLPLARDPDSPLGLRFLAPPETDHPDAIRLPVELPAAALTLRAFRDKAERAGYVAALAEIGDNTFSWILSPDVAGAPPLLLVGRWDRVPHFGDCLDDAVPMTGEPGAAECYAGARKAAAAESALAEARLRVRRSWERESAVLRSLPDMIAFGEGEDTLGFASSASGATYEARRSGEGTRVAFSLRFHRPSPDDPAWRTAVEGRGLRLLPDGRPATGPVTIDADFLRGLDAHAAELAVAADRIADLSRAERALDALLANANARKALAELARGNLVVEPSPGAQCLQVSSRTGGTRVVTSSALGTLWRSGLVEAAWVSPRKGPRSHWPSVYAPTRAAIALGEGDRAPALDFIARNRLPPRFSPPVPPEEAHDLVESLAGLRGLFREEDVERLAAVAATCGRIGQAPPHRASPGEWPPIVSGFLAGTLVLGRGDALEATDHAAPSAPGGP